MTVDAQKKDLSSLQPLDVEFIDGLKDRFTYVGSLFPVLQTEERYGEYYSIFSGHEYSYFADEDSATAAYHNSISQIQQNIKRSQDNLNDPSILYGYSFELALLRLIEFERFDNKKAALEQAVAYGVQQHEETHRVYRLEYPTQLFQYIPDEYVFLNHVLYSPKKVERLLSGIASHLEMLGIQYQETFGYTSLQTALQREPYIQRLCEEYSIHDIFETHQENFRKMNAQHLMKEYIEQRIVLEAARGHVRYLELLKHHTIDYHPDVQRQVMRSLYEQPAIMEHAGTAPLEWLVPAVDTLVADDVVWDYLRNVSDLCALYKY